MWDAVLDGSRTDKSTSFLQCHRGLLNFTCKRPRWCRRLDIEGRLKLLRRRLGAPRSGWRVWRNALMRGRKRWTASNVGLVKAREGKRQVKQSQDNGMTIPSWLRNFHPFIWTLLPYRSSQARTLSTRLDCKCHHPLGYRLGSAWCQTAYLLSNIRNPEPGVLTYFSSKAALHGEFVILNIGTTDKAGA